MAIINANSPWLLTDLIKTIDFNDPEIMKTLYQPSITQQIMDHRVDAMVYNLNGSRAQYDREAEEKRRRNARDVYAEYGQYIDIERPHSAYQRLLFPEMVDKFIWGPCGEFTGIIKDEEAIRQFQGSPTGKWRHQHFTLHMKVNLIPYEDTLIEWGDPNFYQHFSGPNRNGRMAHTNQLIQFENYRDLVEYHSFVNQDYGRERGYTELVYELAGLLQNIRPMRAALLDWMEALKKTKASFGFGCLHDGEGNMDPLGVLAEVNACEWVWDKTEGAYKVKGGDAYTLPDKMLRGYLGVPDDTLTRHVTEFQSRFPGIMDRYTTFKQVNADLQNAMDLITLRLNDVRRMRNDSDRMRVGPAFGRSDSHEDQVVTKFGLLEERQIVRRYEPRYSDLVNPEYRGRMMLRDDWT